MCLPGIIDSEILSGIFGAGSRCLHSFSNKQTSLQTHTAPIILAETRDPRLLSMKEGRHSERLQPGLSFPFWGPVAQRAISTGWSRLESGQSLPCHVLPISISGCLLTHSNAPNSRPPSPSLAESNKGLCRALENFLGKKERR